MSRRSRRVAVNLDARGLKELREDDLKAVLRGTDDIIAQGGRTLLMRILRVFTQKGWEIEREQYANELLNGIKTILRHGPPYQMAHLKDRDRGMILLLLDKIAATGDAGFIPPLEAWKKVDYKNVQQRIRQVIKRLEASSGQ